MEKPDPKYTGNDIVYNFKEHSAKTKDGKYECCPDATGNYMYWWDMSNPEKPSRLGDWQTGYCFVVSKAMNVPAEDADRLNRLIRGEIRNKRWWEENP